MVLPMVLSSSRLDSCNLILSSLPHRLYDSLHPVLPAGDRLSFQPPRKSPVTDWGLMFSKLHWLPFKVESTLRLQSLFQTIPADLQIPLKLNPTRTNLRWDSSGQRAYCLCQIIQISVVSMLSHMLVLSYVMHYQTRLFSQFLLISLYILFISQTTGDLSSMISSNSQRWRDEFINWREITIRLKW